MRVAVAVMSRAPSCREGKTRLLRGFDDVSRLALREALLLDTADAVQCVPRVERVLLHTPGWATGELSRIVPAGWRSIPQRGRDLGERMYHGLVDLIGLGARAAVLVGSDLPTLPPPYVRQAVDLLAIDDDGLVLGPADDGGYYLIGMGRPRRGLFEGIPWGTGAVLDATLDAASALELRTRLLPHWYDVDSPEDLGRVLRETGPSLDRAHRTRRWVAAHQPRLAPMAAPSGER